MLSHSCKQLTLNYSKYLELTFIYKFPFSRQIQANCQRLDQMASNEPPQRRRTVKMRVEQMKFDYNTAYSAVHNIQTRLTNKWRAVAEREELLTQRLEFLIYILHTSVFQNQTGRNDSYYRGQ